MQNFGVGCFARRAGLIALTMTTMIAAGCGGGDGGSPATASTATSNETAAGVNKAPTISATPPAQAAVGAVYKMTPVAQDADGDTLAFSIANKPAWAVFSTTTGELSGMPGAQDVGSFSDVVISVSDGVTSASLPAFSIIVAQAGTPVPADGSGVALSWDVPTTTLDGAPLNDLTGYRIHFGLRADALTNAVEVPSAGLNRYVVQGLEKGTYYFAVRAITASGAQSETSNVITQVIG